jgi:electron transport complex protein RnfD
MQTAPAVISYKPFLHNRSHVSFVHYNILLALLPAAVLGVMHYGMHAARVICLAMAACMLFEAGLQRLFSRPVSITDGSAALTGLLLALILPASAPLWLVLVACAAAILVGKQVFGGLGSNPLNAVLVGWAVIRLSWPDHINLSLALINYDPGFSIKYPLAVLKSAGVKGIADFKLMDLFMGKQAGGIGSGAGLLLVIGGVYLWIRGIISWKIPVFFILGVTVTALLFQAGNGEKYAGPVFHLVAGNVLLGAFFLATDYSSAPNKTWGMLIFGLGCGILTVIFRAWSVYPDGTAFAIIIMNIMTPLLDKVKKGVKPVQRAVRA